MIAARRIAAILAADVGYSRLMGEDQAGTALTQGKRAQHGKPQSVVRDEQPDTPEGRWAG
jgi:hypothetical protein